MSITTSICILTYNRCDSLLALLEELTPLADASTEIIVVDNNSDDRTTARASEKFPIVRFFHNSKNLGAAGRNVAFQNARGDLLICLDDDVFGLTRQMVDELQEKFAAAPALGAVNFQVRDAFTGEVCNWIHHCKADDFHTSEFATYEITEGAVAFRKAALDRAGHYDDIYFISHEGPDLAFRIIREGFDCIYWGRIVVRHRHENAGHHSWMNYYYDTRNHIYLAAKNLPVRYAIRYLCIGLASTLVYSLRDRQLRHWVKAVRDGMAFLPILLKRREVLPEAVLQKMREVDLRDAPFFYKVRTRLFRRGMRL